MSSSSDGRVRTRILRSATVEAISLAALEFEATVDDNAGRAVAVDPRIVEESRRLGYADGFKAGKDEGFKAGHDEGIEAARVRIAQTEAQADQEIQSLHSIVEGLVGAFERAVADVAEQREQVLAGVDLAIAEGAIALAEAILGRELRDPEMRAKDALARALAMAPDHEPVIARVHPDDLDVLELLEAESERIRFEADPSLRSGDCVLTFAHGEIDARVSAAVERARAAIREGIG